jgi:hypothetical protein
MVAAMYMVTRDGKAAWKHSLRGLAVRLQHSWIREVSSTLQAFRVLLGQMLITLSSAFEGAATSFHIDAHGTCVA